MPGVAVDMCMPCRMSHAPWLVGGVCPGHGVCMDGGACARVEHMTASMREQPAKRRIASRGFLGRESCLRVPVNSGGSVPGECKHVSMSDSRASEMCGHVRLRHGCVSACRCPMLVGGSDTTWTRVRRQSAVWGALWRVPSSLLGDEDSGWLSAVSLSAFCSAIRAFPSPLV